MSRTFDSPLFVVTITNTGHVDIVLKPAIPGSSPRTISADELHQAATALLNAARTLEPDDDNLILVRPRVVLLRKDVGYVPSESYLMAEIVIDRFGNVIKNRYGKTHESMPAQPAPRSDDEDPVECEEFYNLMQAYRHEPLKSIPTVVEHYENVKKWIVAWGKRQRIEVEKERGEIEERYSSLFKELAGLRMRLAAALGRPLPTALTTTAEHEEVVRHVADLAAEGRTCRVRLDEAEKHLAAISSERIDLEKRLGDILGMDIVGAFGRDRAIRRVAELVSDDRTLAKFKAALRELIPEVRDLYATVREGKNMVTRVRLCGLNIEEEHVTCGLPAGHPGQCSPR